MGFKFALSHRRASVDGPGQPRDGRVHERPAQRAGEPQEVRDDERVQRVVEEGGRERPNGVDETPLCAERLGHPSDAPSVVLLQNENGKKKTQVFSSWL